MTIEGVTHPLEPPFLVLATQNPIEYEGTYPLPEAQLDRFLLRIGFGYPSRERRGGRCSRGASSARRTRSSCARRSTAQTLLAMQAAIERVHVAPSVGEYIVDLVAATRDVAERRGRREPARQPRAPQARALPGRARGPRLRHARRRQGGRGAGARAPARAPPGALGAAASRPRTSSARCSRRVPTPRGGGRRRRAARVTPIGDAAARRRTRRSRRSGSSARSRSAGRSSRSSPRRSRCSLAIGTARSHASPSARARLSTRRASARSRATSSTPSSRRAPDRPVDRLELLLELPRRRSRSSTARHRRSAAPPRRRGARARARPPLRALGRLRARRASAARARPRSGSSSGRARSSGRSALKVYPTPETLRRLVAPVETQALAGSEVARQKGEGVEFADIRDFVPGDRVRSINWRATRPPAGRSSSTSAIRSATRTSCSSSTASPTSRGGGRSVARATPCARPRRSRPRYLERRDRVGLVSFGGVLRWLQPGMGTTQRYRLVEALLETGVDANYTWQDVNVIPARILPPQALVLAVTPLARPRASSTALEDLRGAPLRRRGRRGRPRPARRAGPTEADAARVPALAAASARCSARGSSALGDRRRDVGRRRDARRGARGGEGIPALRATGARLATGAGSVVVSARRSLAVPLVARQTTPFQRSASASAPSRSSRSSPRVVLGWSPLVPVGRRARRRRCTPPSSRSTTRRSTSPRRRSPPGCCSCAELALLVARGARRAGSDEAGDGLRRAALVALLGVGRARRRRRLLALVDAVRAARPRARPARRARRGRRCSRRVSRAPPARQRQPSNGA